MKYHIPICLSMYSSPISWHCVELIGDGEIQNAVEKVYANKSLIPKYNSSRS